MNYNNYNQNINNQNNIYYNNTIEQNSNANGYNQQNNNQVNIQVNNNYNQMNSQNQNIYRPPQQGYYPQPQQMDQPVNKNLSFNPVNSNYNPAAGFSSGNNVNIYGNNSYNPAGNYGYSSHS